MKICLLAGGIIIPLFAFATIDAYSASIQGSEITLCNGGYRSYSADTDSVSCVPYAAGSCSAGYIQYPKNSSTFIGLYGDRCAISTYHKENMPDTLVSLSYSGLVTGSEITLCDGGYMSYNNGSPTCVSYAKHDCENGFVEFTNNTNTFIGVYDNKCVLSTYKKKSVPDNLVALTYRGTTSGSELTLCNHGYMGYVDGASSCHTYGSGYCWDNYYAIPLGSTTFNAPSSGACASNAHTYNTTACGYAPTTDTCLDVCDNGQLHTDADTCASLCELGATTVRTSNGLIIPMWSTKQTDLAVNIGFNDGVCYVNLESGTTSDPAIMFEYENTTYHTTK